VLVLVRGNINILGDMYAFGLLGAFTLTCIGMDVVRYRQRKDRALAKRMNPTVSAQAREQIVSTMEKQIEDMPAKAREHLNAQALEQEVVQEEDQSEPAEVPEPEGRWTRSTFNFVLGIITTVLVVTAWSTNLLAKPLATAFGGSVAVLGMLIAYTSQSFHRRRGRIPVITTGVERHFPAAVLAVLTPDHQRNLAIIDAAVNNPGGKPVVFLYMGEQSSTRQPELFRLVEPHLNDELAGRDMSIANKRAEDARVECRFLYRHREPEAAYTVWQMTHPYDTIVAPDEVNDLQQIKPDRSYEEATAAGRVVHLLKGGAGSR
jgi:hypothetical protein